MFEDADKFPLYGLFGYLANITTFLVNAGLIAGAIWAWRHWGALGKILERIERLLRDAVEALRDYSAAMREASRRSTPEPRSEGEPVTSPKPQSTTPPPRVSAAINATPPLSKSTQDSTPPQRNDQDIKRPGCLGYLLTVGFLVALAVFARCTMQPIVPDKAPQSVKIGTTPKPGAAAPQKPPEKSQEPWSYYSQNGDSCWKIALRASGGDPAKTASIWLEIMRLNPEKCSRDHTVILAPGAQLRIPAGVTKDQLVAS